MGKTKALLLSVLLVALCLGCGGNNSETQSDTGFHEMFLTREKLDKYVGFHQDWFAKIKDDVSDFESKGDVRDFTKAMRYGKKSEKELNKILKKNGLDLDEFQAIDETFSSIMQVVVREKFISSQSSFSASFGSEGIAEMKKLLDNPNNPDEQKGLIREQIEEMQKGQSEMGLEKKQVQTEIKAFNPKNVALVREYMSKVWGIYGGPGSLPE